MIVEAIHELSHIGEGNHKILCEYHTYIHTWDDARTLPSGKTSWNSVCLLNIHTCILILSRNNSWGLVEWINYTHMHIDLVTILEHLLSICWFTNSPALGKAIMKPCVCNTHAYIPCVCNTHAYILSHWGQCIITWLFIAAYIDVYTFIHCHT